MEEYLTLREAAQRMGVSEKTIRNRIKRRELAAELREGSNGPQYYIPAEAISEQPKTVHDVVMVKRPISVTELAQAIHTQFSGDLEDAKEEIRNLTRAVEELQKTIEQIATTKQKPWWKRW